MDGLMLIVSVIVIMLVMASILAFFDRVGGCNHKWDMWECKEDSSVFFQKRQCSKCGYTQFEQVRKLVEIKDGL